MNYEPFAPQDMRQVQGDSSHIDSVNQQLLVLGKAVLTTENTVYFDVSDIHDFKLPPPGVVIRPPLNTDVTAAGFFAQLESKPDLLINVSGKEQNDIVVAEVLIILPFSLDTTTPVSE